MDKTVLTSAIIGGLISGLTALFALWSQPDVAQFSDIAPVAYAVALGGGVLAGLKDVQARKAKPPQ